MVIAPIDYQMMAEFKNPDLFQGLSMAIKRRGIKENT